MVVSCGLEIVMVMFFSHSLSLSLSPVVLIGELGDDVFFGFLVFPVVVSFRKKEIQ